MSEPRIFKTENLAPMRATREMLHDMAVTYAEEEFDRRGQVPFLWLIAIGTRVLWLETPWENDWEKNASVRVLRRMMAELEVQAYAQMCEAWIAVVNADKDGKLPIDHRMPSEMSAKERDDVLMVSSYDRDGGCMMTRYLVSLRPGGRNLLGPRVDIDTEHERMTGRMFNLLAEEEDDGD